MPNTYSTSKVVRGNRLTYWNDLHSRLLTPLEIKALDRTTFQASASIERVGDLTMMRAESLPATIEHRARHVAQTKERRFRLLMNVSGRLGVRHVGRELVLEEGDFVLLDDAAPYRVDFREPNVALGFMIAPPQLRKYLPTPALLCGLRMPATRPLNAVFGAMLRGVWTQAECGMPAAQAQPLSRSLLQVLATTFALERVGAVEPSFAAASRRAEIKQYIELNLRNPDLGPTMIAAALGLSRRYMRLLFAGERESVSAYVRRRRLEECALEFTRAPGRSITATASDWGFRSMAHFARAFRSRYDQTPTAFRRRRRAANLQPKALR